MSRLITIEGETRTLSGWARLVGITPAGFHHRLNRGIDEFHVVEPPAGEKPLPFDPANLIAAAERHYGLRAGDILGGRRFFPIALARQAVMYTLRVEAGMPFPEIACTLRLKDHTTVMHGCRAICQRACETPSIVSDLYAIWGRVSA